MALICWDFDNTVVWGQFRSYLEGIKLPADIQYNEVDELAERALANVFHFQGTRKGKKKDDNGNFVDHEETITADRQGFRHPEQIAKAFEDAINNGHFVAITSFNDYEQITKAVMKKFLRQHTSLTDEQIESSFAVFTGFPGLILHQKYGDEYESHAQAEMEAHGVTEVGAFGKQLHIKQAMEWAGMDYEKDRGQVALLDDNYDNILVAKTLGHVGIAVAQPLTDTVGYFMTLARQLKKWTSGVAADKKPIVSAYQGAKANAATGNIPPPPPPPMPK